MQNYMNELETEKRQTHISSSSAITKSFFLHSFSPFLLFCYVCYFAIPEMRFSCVHRNNDFSKLFPPMIITSAEFLLYIVVENEFAFSDWSCEHTDTATCSLLVAQRCVFRTE